MQPKSENKFKITYEEDDAGNGFIIYRHGFTTYKLSTPDNKNDTPNLPKIGFGIREQLNNLISELDHIMENADLDDDESVKKIINRHGNENKAVVEWLIHMLHFKFKTILKDNNWDAKSADALRLAFHLGVEAGGLVRDFYWKFEHEDAAIEGHLHRAGREAGRPAATAKRIQMGKKTRRAVISTAKNILSEQPKLRFNLTRLAQAIERQRLDALRKSDGTYLGYHAIYKHLKSARNDEII